MTPIDYSGRAAAPQMPAYQHRGSEEHSTAELQAKYPIIRVAGEKVEVRKDKNHDFRNNTSDYVQRWLCNLCGKTWHDPIHRF